MRKPYNKLSDGAKEYIRRKFGANENTARELAIEFHVTVQTIYNVIGKDLINARIVAERTNYTRDARERSKALSTAQGMPAKPPLIKMPTNRSTDDDSSTTTSAPEHA